MRSATIGLVGVGNIGMHPLDRLGAEGAAVIAIEGDPDRRAQAAARGARVFAPGEKAAFLAIPMDALAVNANKSSLDPASVELIVRNPRLRVVCGSENLAMPDPASADRLRDAARAYAPTELGDMMGFVTAAEEYLARLDDSAFDVATMHEAARMLEPIGESAVRRMRDRAFAISFEQAVHDVAGE